MGRHKRPPETQSRTEPPAAEVSAAAPAPSPPLSESRVGWGLLGLALLARFLFLGRADLWADEVLFTQSAMPPQTPWQVFAAHWQRFLAIGHLPLPPVVQNVFLWIANWFSADLSYATFLQRIPSALWSSATVPLLYRMARRVVSRRQALFAALMLAVFFFPVYHGREAYFYGPLLFFTIAALNYLFRILEEGRLTRRSGILLFLSLVAAEYCHMTGAILTLVIFVSVTVAVGLNKAPPHWDATVFRKAGLRLWLLCIGAAVTVGPFFYQMITATPHQWPAPPEMANVLLDFLPKTFLGVTIVGSILSWIVLAAGLWAALTGRVGRYQQRALILILALCYVGVLFGVMSTQYSPRYFYITLGPLYILFALGIDWIARTIAAIYRRPDPFADRCGAGMLGVLLAVHFLVFLPPSYRLTSRSLDYGGIARWLNANLPPGTPYVFESGYDQRFVPGYFRTPNLVTAVPYVHGPGTEEMLKLRERQQQFFLQFPEACYVEASRHGLTGQGDYGVWEWPHQYFQRSHVLKNEALARMISYGIAPGAYEWDPGLRVLLETPVWYNTSEDVERQNRLAGRPVLFRYDTWGCVEINRFVYARAANPPEGAISVRNLRGTALRGRFLIRGGIVADERGYSLDVKLDGQSLVSSVKWPGILWSLETPPADLLPGDHTLALGLPPADAATVRALLAIDVQFLEGEGAPAAPESAEAPSRPAGQESVPTLAPMPGLSGSAEPPADLPQPFESEPPSPPEK